MLWGLGGPVSSDCLQAMVRLGDGGVEGRCGGLANDHLSLADAAVDERPLHLEGGVHESKHLPSGGSRPLRA